ncbi:MAG: hypothetical protein EOP49_14535 [Sphingobacteriales bacterium]|nr:MAG: hypothetical protein EOP49_14535 [Sphingobacteriales bacterium]
MKFTFFFIAISLVILSACNNSSPVPEAREEAKDTVAAQPVIPTTEIKNIQKDSIIRFAFAPGVDSAIGKGHLDKKGEPVICYIEVESGRKIIGKVIPDKAGANIRFSHIYMPDGSSDGPFGQTIEYIAKKKGLYRLFISPNRMAGDPESTDFTVVIALR